MEQTQATGDALAERCAQAEQRAADLEAELEAARARIAELEAAAAAPISIFDGAGDEGPAGQGLARDGSDPRVLPMALAATSVVACLVALLALVNGNFFTTLGFTMVVAAVALAIAAAKTRVPRIDVHVTRGVVYIDKGDSSYRFDLRNAGTRVDMVRQPGDPSWAVHFHRKGMDDFVVDSTMVDAHEFARQLREHRPDL